MKKLQEISRLVEEALTPLEIVKSKTSKVAILTSLARKCAEINVSDLVTDCNGVINTYNSRLRDGQVEEVKQEPKPALQPLPDEMPKEFEDYMSEHTLLYSEKVEAWNWLAKTYGTQQSNLQPLPDEMPEWFMHTSSKGIRTSIWNQLRYHFGTQPREWWMDLKKGDDFMYDNGVDWEKRTFSGVIYLAAEQLEICDLSKCSPYTDPTQSFRSKLTPEMQVEFDKLVSSLTPNTPQP